MGCWAQAEPSCWSLLQAARQLSAGSIVDQRRGDRSLDNRPMRSRTESFWFPKTGSGTGLFPEMSIRENIAMAAMHGIVYFARSSSWSACASLSRTEHRRQRSRIACDLSFRRQSAKGADRALPDAQSLLSVAGRADARRRCGSEGRDLCHPAPAGAKGIGILFTSSEIEETRALADRALVLCQGRISAEFARNEITDEALFAAASPSSLHCTNFRFPE